MIWKSATSFSASWETPVILSECPLMLPSFSVNWVFAPNHFGPFVQGILSVGPGRIPDLFLLGIKDLGRFDQAEHALGLGIAMGEVFLQQLYRAPGLFHGADVGGSDFGLAKFRFVGFVDAKEAFDAVEAIFLDEGKLFPSQIGVFNGSQAESNTQEEEHNVLELHRVVQIHRFDDLPHYFVGICFSFGE